MPSNSSSGSGGESRVSSSVDDLLLAAMERGDGSMHTGRYLVTFRDDAAEAGVRSLDALGMRTADARDFGADAATLAAAGDADAFVFPHLGVALIGGDAMEARGMSLRGASAVPNPVRTVEPERFVFAQGTTAEYVPSETQDGRGMDDEYLRGFMKAAQTIFHDLQRTGGARLAEPMVEEALDADATWGLVACGVPGSGWSGEGVRVAILDTGMDVGHPDFADRSVTTAQFVGQAVQDLNGHGTHCIGTACGPREPGQGTPRYGIAYRASIFAGKVLSNSGWSVDGSVLRGMDWAVENRCEVISLSLGGPGGPVEAYTRAGQSALDNGLLIVAAAGNEGGPTGAPANSPTILSVAWLNEDLRPSTYSNSGKIDIAAPGNNVFSSWPRPLRYRAISGTSMATPHVAGCAALWAQSDPNLRGMKLWRKLVESARVLPFPNTRAGGGLVQAP